MNSGSDELATLLLSKEDEQLEFKEAKEGFHFDKLVEYCAAIANEGGGRFVLGVTDKRPRRVVGTRAFESVERTTAGLVERLRLRLEIDELEHNGLRVLIVRIPARPLGVPIPVNGAYLMRAGEDLVPMTPDRLRRIFAETGPDFSAEICPGAKFEDLDPDAIATFRQRWSRKSNASRAVEADDAQLLHDADLLVDGGVTYAALVLCGKPKALGRHLAQAEVVFEFRSSDEPGPASFRHEFREGLLLVHDQLWHLVNLRNDLQHFQDGLFVVDVPTFSERTVREAILNAVCHRDYRDAGSVFIRQFPRRIEIVSPGGFPSGITTQNLLWKQKSTNRRIAEALARCGLIERAGQGFDLIYSESIQHSKPLPDFSRTDDHSVWLTLHGTIQDPAFLRFLEQVARENQVSFHLQDLLVLDLVHRDQKVPPELARRIAPLIDHGVLERVGRGRGVRHLLSQRYFQSVGRAGDYTRRVGLDRETNKALLAKHIKGSKEAGAPLFELQEVLPALSRDQVQTLLRAMKAEGTIHVSGATRAARWFLGPKRNPTQ